MQIMKITIAVLDSPLVVSNIHLYYVNLNNNNNKKVKAINLLYVGNLQFITHAVQNKSIFSLEKIYISKNGHSILLNYSICDTASNL